MEAHLTSSPAFLTLLEDAQIRTSFSKATLRTLLSPLVPPFPFFFGILLFFPLLLSFPPPASTFSLLSFFFPFSHFLPSPFLSSLFLFWCPLSFFSSRSPPLSRFFLSSFLSSLRAPPYSFSSSFFSFFPNCSPIPYLAGHHPN